MASLIAASSAVITAPRENVAGSSRPLKSAFLGGSKSASEWSQKTVCNGSRVSCMLTWQPYDNKRFETLSYLPPLSNEQISKELEYMMKNGWFPCLEFSDKGTVYREHNASPGYYDGRYWTMWKLPMFGCNDAAAVLREIEECKKAFPDNYVRVLGFDNKRQVQCAGFLVSKP